MSKANSWRKAPLAVIAAGLAGAILLAAQAQAEITRTTAVAENTAAASVSARNETQRVRCWQEGRLIIDEPAIATGRDMPGSALKLRDPKKREMFIATTANTTCLIQPAGEAPAPAAASR